jgi:CheY-like chemotaxis protein
VVSSGATDTVLRRATDCGSDAPRVTFVAAVIDVDDQGAQLLQAAPTRPTCLDSRAEEGNLRWLGVHTLVEHGSITVLVVDDHCGFRRALESLIRSAPDLLLLGSVSDGEEAVRLSAQLHPRVVVMDLVMSGVNGVEATRRLLHQQLPPTVVALSGSHELIRDAVAAGAAFTALKDVDPECLLRLIRAAGRQGVR